MKIITAGTTRIAVMALPSASSRREAEAAARGMLLDAILGAGSQLGHWPDGAPYIVGSPVYVSVSHSRRQVAVAVDASRRIGIDMEGLDRAEQLARVASRFLTPDEQGVCAGEPHGLVRAWTVKEAMFKITREPDLRRLPLDGAPVAYSAPEGPDWLTLAVCPEP